MDTNAEPVPANPMFEGRSPFAPAADQGLTTMRERRAARIARGESLEPRRRLVSVGWGQIPMPMPGRANEGKVQMVNAELLYDADDPTKFYHRYERNGPVHRVNEDSSLAAPAPEPLGTFDPNDPRKRMPTAIS